MTRSILFASLATGLIASAASAEVLQFDLGYYSQQTTDPTWNNIPNTPSDNAPQDIGPGLVVSTTGATPYGVDASGFGTAQFHGIAGIGANWDGPYPAGITGPGAEGGPAGSDMALRDGTYARNGDLGEIVITELVPGSTWNLVFYGGRGNNGADVDFTASSLNAGAASISNVFQNSMETCAILGIVVDGSGELAITQTTAGAVSGAWNALVMTTEDVGTPACFGDGTGSACPCGNTGGAGEGCANSSGSGSFLTISGSSSLMAADLILQASGQPDQPGIFFQGNDTLSPAPAFGDGLRCAGNGVLRWTPQNSNGGCASTDSPGALNPGGTGCGSYLGTGTYQGSPPGHPGNAGLSAGDTRTYQYWYRDPAGSPCGAGFNTSNAMEVTWGA